MAVNAPISVPLTAAAGAAGTAQVPITTRSLTVWNRTGAGEVFLTVNGSGATVGGDNQWYLPGAITSVTIPVDAPNQAEASETGNLTISAVSSAALSLWVQVND